MLVKIKRKTEKGCDYCACSLVVSNVIAKSLKKTFLAKDNSFFYGRFYECTLNKDIKERRVHKKIATIFLPFLA